MNRGERWDVSVDKWRPDVVVLGVGAHIRSVQLLSKILTMFTDQYRRDYGKYRKKLFVWKTMSPAGCGPRILTHTEKLSGSWKRCVLAGERRGVPVR